MKRIIALILALTMLSLTLVGCSGDSPSDPDSSTPSQSDSSSEDSTTGAPQPGDMITITDTEGITLEVPFAPTKVVNCWPSSTSVFALIGAGDLLISCLPTSINSEWIQFFSPGIVEATPLEDNNNVEAIAALEPELVVVHGSQQGVETAAALNALGVPAVNLAFNDYESMQEAFTILGTILGGEYQERLQAWCDYVDDWTGKIDSTLADVDMETAPVLYYSSASIKEDGTLDLTKGMGAGGIQQSWTNTCGAQYLMDVINAEGSEITEEALLSANPDVIVISGITQEELDAALPKTTLWADVEAVKNGQVYLIPQGTFSWARFGIESCFMLPWLSQVLYPEQFADTDMDQEMLTMYETFSGVKLTDQQIQNIKVGLGPND